MAQESLQGSTEGQETSQIQNESPYEENAAENKIRQPFVWGNAGDVLKYKISIYEINEKSGKKNLVYTHETTEEENTACQIYIEPPLPPGRYESQIIVYNILGGVEEELSSKDEFVIHKAFMPEIRSISYPLYMRSTIYLDDLDNDGILEISGRNLFRPSSDEGAETKTSYELLGTRTLRPQKVVDHDDKNNRKISLQFDMSKLDVGEYNLYAQDASGLHSEMTEDSKLIVKFKKLMDLDIEAGYICPLALHDTTFPEYLATKFYPISGQAKVTFIPFKRLWGYLGLALRASYTRLNAEFDGYSIDGNLGTANLLFVYQKATFRRRLFLELHGGPGITYFNNMYFHFPHNIESERLDTLSLSVDAGAAAQFYINKRLYTEIQLDYLLTLNSDMSLGMLMPSAGIGWQF